MNRPLTKGEVIDVKTKKVISSDKKSATRARLKSQHRGFSQSFQIDSDGGMHFHDLKPVGLQSDATTAGAANAFQKRPEPKSTSPLDHPDLPRILSGKGAMSPKDYQIFDAALAESQAIHDAHEHLPNDVQAFHNDFVDKAVQRYNEHHRAIKQPQLKLVKDMSILAKAKSCGPMHKDYSSDVNRRAEEIKQQHREPKEPSLSEKIKQIKERYNPSKAAPKELTKQTPAADMSSATMTAPAPIDTKAAHRPSMLGGMLQKAKSWKVAGEVPASPSMDKSSGKRSLAKLLRAAKEAARRGGLRKDDQQAPAAPAPKPETHPHAPKTTAAEYLKIWKEAWSNAGKKEPIKKDDKPHPPGSPEDTAHDIVEERKPLRAAIADHLKDGKVSAMLRHLRGAKSEEGWERSEANQAAGKDK